MTWWQRLDQFLNPSRTRYALLAGGALWIAWLVSILLGPGNMDLARQVVGTDYLAYYSSGIILRQGESINLYNLEYQRQIQTAVAGSALTTFFGISTPPFYPWLYVPLTYLPYILSFAVWSTFSLLCLWLSLNWLGFERPGIAFLWVLTWFPIFAAISFGENSLLSVAILSLTYLLWRQKRSFLAGLACSVLLYKPQLILGVGLLWLLEWRKDWKSLFGLGLGGGFGMTICFALLPSASQAFITYTLNTLPTFFASQDFPIWHDHVLRAFWLLLFPSHNSLAEILALLFSGLGIYYFYRLWRVNRQDKALLYGAATCLTIWITPHAMIYDWALLVIPAILFWKSRPDLRGLWKPLYVILWATTLISGSLTYGQRLVLPFAIQISIPIYALALITTVHALTSFPHPPPKPSPQTGTS